MRARLLFALVFALLCLPVLVLHADPVRLEAQAVQQALTEWAREDVSWLEVEWPGDAAAIPAKRDALRAAMRIEGAAAIDEVEGVYRIPLALESGVRDYHIRVEVEDGWLRLLSRTGIPALFSLATQDGGEVRAPAQRVGSRWSLLPPLLAILLAFLTRSILPSLLLGVLAGVFLMLEPGAGVGGYIDTLVQHILWEDILTDSFHLYILGFVLALSSTVSLVSRMGGIEGMVRSLLRFAKSSRSVQTVAYAMGLGIFFDDYANTIIVGNSCGPLFDKMKISRAKLAYIVDSTAAPVAGVALLSTWVAYQISTYAPQLPTIGMEASDGYALFLRTIPYRFYCLMALAMVGAVILLQRDFGPMRQIEEAARRGDGEGGDPSSVKMSHVEPARNAVPRWYNGLLPILLMVFGTFALILWSGSAALAGAAADGDSAASAAIDSGGIAWVTAVLGSADSTWAIFFGSVAALLLAVFLALGQRLLSGAEVAHTAFTGMGPLFKDAVLVLILAWSIGAVCQGIGTAGYLVAVFEDLLSPALLPVMLFLAACFVAFATGSSWTTMAILQPNVVLLAWELGKDSPIGSEMLLVMSIGAVLEGAIFGDHCSPISDTTVLSSAASRCLHIDHVRTQAPYALATAAAAILCAYLPVALLGMSPWLGLALGIAVLTALVRLVGHRIPDPAASGT